jgi:hypothetical protein
VSRTTALALLAAVAVTVAGCAAADNPTRRGSTSPQVRCLVDPHETGTRPLIFLFCIESP